MGYIIVGDTEKYKGALVRALYGKSWTKAKAESYLKELLESEDRMDRLSIQGHTNLRIEETESEQEWWNDPILVN